MSTVIYLSNQKIHIIEGKRGKTVSVERCLTLDAPQGTIINGIVMDPEPFGAFLKETWASNKLSTKDVYLVVNSTKFIGQNMEFPKMNDEKSLGYIKRGFSNIDRSEEKIYGFVRLGGSQKKMQKLYAESVSPDYIKDYVALFQNIGIILKGIYSGEGGIIGLLNNTAAKQYKTFILMIADSMTLTTILYVNRVFTYYNSVRCFHEPGTEDYAQDLTRSASQIRQFMQANQIEYELEDILLAGVSDSDLNLYSDYMKNSGVQARVSIFTDGKAIRGAMAKEAQSYLLAVSGLFVNDSNSNYLELFNKKKVEKKGTSNAKYFIILVATLVFMAGVFALSLMYANKTKAELDELKEYNESTAILMQVEMYDTYAARNSFLIRQYLSIAEINENLKTYPWATSAVQQDIYKLSEGYADIPEFTSCNADSGDTNMTVTAKEVLKINQYISVLKLQKELLTNIAYTGYSYNEESEDYTVNVTCTLAEAVGRKDID